MSLAVLECGDFSEFQDALQRMRKVDDIIINTINTAIPTDSFHPDGTSACKNLHAQITDGNEKRTKVIKSCINLTADRVKKLKEERDKDVDDVMLSKSLRSEQTKVWLKSGFLGIDPVEFHFLS